MTNLDSIPTPRTDWRESPNGQSHYLLYRFAGTACVQLCEDGQVFSVDLSGPPPYSAWWLGQSSRDRPTGSLISV
jgi:hypothetical protein